MPNDPTAVPRPQAGQTLGNQGGFQESRSETLEKERIAAAAAAAIAAANAAPPKPAGSLGYSMPNDPTAVPREQIGQTLGYPGDFQESRSEKLEKERVAAAAAAAIAAANAKPMPNDPTAAARPQIGQTTQGGQTTQEVADGGDDMPIPYWYDTIDPNPVTGKPSTPTAGGDDGDWDNDDDYDEYPDTNDIDTDTSGIKDENDMANAHASGGGGPTAGHSEAPLERLLNFEMRNGEDVGAGRRRRYPSGLVSTDQAFLVAESLLASNHPLAEKRRRL